jgi:hypothetical protein
MKGGKNTFVWYFRPRTPTQYNNEGFRPVGQRELNSHCPVPVFFLFNSKELLTRKDILFSKGSLASKNSSLYEDAKSFIDIPFKLVYHDSSFSNQDKDTIIYHRHAEVVAFEELDLDNLKYIFCRSEAEYQTLVDLLKPEIYRKWEKMIGTTHKANLFFKNWIYVDKVDLGKESINIKFNLPACNINKVHMRIDIHERTTGKKYVWEIKDYTLEPTREIILSNILYPDSYRAQIFLDDQIMYSKEYNATDNDFPY